MSEVRQRGSKRGPGIGRIAGDSQSQPVRRISTRGAIDGPLPLHLLPGGSGLSGAGEIREALALCSKGEQERAPAPAILLWVSGSDFADRPILNCVNATFFTNPSDPSFLFTDPICRW